MAALIEDGKVNLQLIAVFILGRDGLDSDGQQETLDKLLWKNGMAASKPMIDDRVARPLRLVTILERLDVTADGKVKVSVSLMPATPKLAPPRSCLLGIGLRRTKMERDLAHPVRFTNPAQSGQ